VLGKKVWVVGRKRKEEKEGEWARRRELNHDRYRE
jgi:hypothetical protein